MMFCSETIAVSPEKFSMIPPKKVSVPHSYNIIAKKSHSSTCAPRNKEDLAISLLRKM